MSLRDLTGVEDDSIASCPTDSGTESAVAGGGDAIAFEEGSAEDASAGAQYAGAEPGEGAKVGDSTDAGRLRLNS